MRFRVSSGMYSFYTNEETVDDASMAFIRCWCALGDENPLGLLISIERIPHLEGFADADDEIYVCTKAIAAKCQVAVQYIK